jgi:hypothetical protein
MQDVWGIITARLSIAAEQVTLTTKTKSQALAKRIGGICSKGQGPSSAIYRRQYRLGFLLRILGNVRI